MSKFKAGDKVAVDGDRSRWRYVVGYNRKGGLVLDYGDGTVYTVNPDHNYELIPEPRKIEGWVNVYFNSQKIFKTKRDADWENNECTARIACIYVSGTEGTEP